MVAQTINSHGEIVGEAFDQSTGGAPAFLGQSPAITETTAKLIHQQDRK
jgi:hypothetical protein